MIQTIKELAMRLGCAVSTVKKAKAAGLIERNRDGGFDVRRARRAIAVQGARRGGQVLGNTGGLSPALIAIKEQQAQEELELTRAKRMAAQQALAKSAGELLVRSEMLRAWMDLLMNFRDGLTNVANQIALRCDLKPARTVAEIVRGAHDDLLRALAEGGGRIHAVGGPVKR